MGKPSTDTPHQVLRIEDLDRDELLYLIQESGAVRVTQRVLWRVRWEVLEGRASALRAIVGTCIAAYEAAAPGPRREALWKAYEQAREKCSRAERKADRAYAVLDATR